MLIVDAPMIDNEEDDKLPNDDIDDDETPFNINHNKTLAKTPSI